MLTFLVTQSCGKERVINDGRAGEQNEWSEMRETIATISVDVLAIAVHDIVDAIRVILTYLDQGAPLEALQAALPEWCELRFSLDDMPDAYNGVPVLPGHARGNIIGLWSPETEQWMYVA